MAGEPSQADAPIPGTPEHDAAMAAKFEATQGGGTPPAPEKAERPEHVPEKFWNAETGEINHAEWAKSYAELEGKLSAGEKKPEGEKKADEGDPPASDEEAAKALEGKGLDYGKYAAEFMEGGELTQASYDELAKAGVTKDVVDAHIAGQIALAEQRDAQGYELAGGKENFGRMAEWAKSNMTKPELAAFNKAVNGSIDEMKLAVSGLKSRFESANGRDPQLLGGSNAPNVGGGYASRAEMVRDMQNPLYAKDPAFRAKVEAKVAASSTL